MKGVGSFICMLMICAVPSAAPIKKPLRDRLMTTFEPASHRKVIEAARVALDRASNRQTAARALPGACDPAFFSNLGLDGGW